MHRRARDGIVHRYAESNVINRNNRGNYGLQVIFAIAGLWPLLYSQRNIDNLPNNLLATNLWICVLNFDDKKKIWIWLTKYKKYTLVSRDNSREIVQNPKQFEQFPDVIAKSYTNQRLRCWVSRSLDQRKTRYSVFILRSTNIIETRVRDFTLQDIEPTICTK